jgi:superfamily II DNA or RNA helicase
MLKFVFDVKKNKKGVIISENLDMLREHFSVENKGANIARYRKYRKISSLRKYIITPSGQFNIGMFNEIYKYLVNLQIPFKIDLTKEFKSQFQPKYPFNKISNLNLLPYSYQQKAIERCLAHGRGIIEIGTGGGKTLTMALLIKTCQENIKNHKTLLVVPGIQLIQQTYSAFIDYGIDPSGICMVSANQELNTQADIIIASMQILTSKKHDTKYFKNLDLVLVDEVHKLKKDNKICKIILSIPTSHKFGFTGSLPEDNIDKWNMYGIIGPHLYTRNSKQLRDDKFLSKAHIHILRLQHLDFPPYHEIEDLSREEKNQLLPTAKYQLENDYIYNNKWRNTIIASLCSKLDKNILIIVDRIEHSETLQKYINTKNKKIFFIQGSLEVDERERIRALMEKEDNIICIAMSKIFSTGIDIKNLPYIIFALAGKAKTKIVQSIGRGLRLHKNKNKLIIFDLVDNYYYAIEHLQKRKLLYNKEQITYTERRIYEKRKDDRT